MSEWGNPMGVISHNPVLNKIGTEERTRGTETSKYPEEEKENSIPKVAASEQGRAQTRSDPGVVGLPEATRNPAERSGKTDRRE